MPELPETETIARDLDREIRGRIITSVEVIRADVLREVSATELSERLTGAKVLRSWRRAKLIVLELDSGDRLVVQPRFTGALKVGQNKPDHEIGGVITALRTIGDTAAADEMERTR